MKPDLKFWRWLDAWELEHGDLANLMEEFSGYGWLIRMVAVIYVRMCTLAGGKDEDFEL